MTPSGIEPVTFRLGHRMPPKDRVPELKTGSARSHYVENSIGKGYGPVT